MTTSNDMETLRLELKAKIESETTAIRGDQAALERYLTHFDDDHQLVRFVVQNELKARGGSPPEEMEDVLKAPCNLLKEMLLADGAKGAQWGPALRIYQEILDESTEAAKSSGILNRLALAVALEHAVPITQANPVQAQDGSDSHVDPIRRYLNYEMAFLEGELDPAFDDLTAWELRFVVDGNEPDETLAWGREMLRNYRPDHALSRNYVRMVNTNIAYGGHRVKYDKPNQQNYQNILMNGGVCGRRAFFGRFLCRAFGIPTTARPSRGHGALVHWTPNNGWVVKLGPAWGKGWTKTLYKSDLDFLATTKARASPQNKYLSLVKRAQWIGDVMGETRFYGTHDDQLKKKPLGFWYGLSLQMQQKIIDNYLPKTPSKTPENDNNVRQQTIVQRVLGTPTPPNAKTISYDSSNGMITIPAAAYLNPRRVKDVQVMTCINGGLQIYLPAFAPQGLTIMRGGTFKADANACCSGVRLKSGGYGKYHDWGFRLAMSSGGSVGSAICFDLGGNTQMELVFIPPGAFVMGGESNTDGRFKCIEVPKHKVQLTQGFYLGKYPVTQAQYKAVMGSNPSKSTKNPNCPVDNIGVDDARDFCTKLVDTIGREFRLPTEAEWEYACRAGSDQKWFFGNDVDLGEYAWFQDNSGGHSHPVGQKKPNPFGLHDMYGNVLERVSDTYAKDFYAKSPAVDPTGPVQGSSSTFEYKISANQAALYSLVVEVLTANEDQRLNVRVNDGDVVVMSLPYTCGKWKKTNSVRLSLKHGENTLRFWRDKPPQYGIAIKHFHLEPIS